jgi:hypothetical protein
MTTPSSILRITGILACASILLLSSCKKKEIQGPKGDPGANGIGGNASITTTTVFTVASSQWVADSAAECRRVTISAAQITKSIMEKGAVRVYIQPDAAFGVTAWTELPFVRGDLFTQFGFSEGELHLQYLNIEGGLPPVPATASYRMVLVSEVQ